MQINIFVLPNGGLKSNCSTAEARFYLHPLQLHQTKMYLSTKAELLLHASSTRQDPTLLPTLNGEARGEAKSAAAPSKKLNGAQIAETCKFEGCKMC